MKVPEIESCFARSSSYGSLLSVAGCLHWRLYEGRDEADQKQKQADGGQDGGDQFDWMTSKIDRVGAPSSGQDPDGHDRDVNDPMQGDSSCCSPGGPRGGGFDRFELARQHGIR